MNLRLSKLLIISVFRTSSTSEEAVGTSKTWRDQGLCLFVGDGDDCDDEAESNFSFEGGPLSSKKDCKKDPDHEKFIPIIKFNRKCLPPRYRDNDLVDFIKAQSDLTVRVCGRGISEKRPATYPDSRIRFPGYKYRGRSEKERTGSGSVEHVRKYTELEAARYKKTCECDSCKESDQPHKVWGKIFIRTAAHVVFDDSEAQNTTCDFFYDGYPPESDPGSAFSLHGFKVVECDIRTDVCTMSYATHDHMELMDRVKEMWLRSAEMLGRVEILDMHTQDNTSSVMRVSGDSSTFNPNSKLTVLTSHPHGCYKQVTIGNWVERQESAAEGHPYLRRRTAKTCYTYTTSSCPGSSGAPVYIMGIRSVLTGSHIHRMENNQRKLNVSAGGREIPNLQSISSLQEGQSEVRECSPLMADFLCNRLPFLYLKDLVHHVVEFSKDICGARFIVGELEFAYQEEIALVFTEILPELDCLVRHGMGHHVILKVFDLGSPIQRKAFGDRLKGQVLSLTLHPGGSRVIQKALALLPKDMQTELVKELDGHILRCIMDKHGNQVVQSWVEHVNSKCILNAVKGQVLNLSVDDFGSCVIQCLIEHCTEDQTGSMLEELSADILDLARQRNGSGVVQSIIKYCTERQRAPVLDELCPHTLSLAGDREGYKVIQCILEHGRTADKQKIVETITENVVTLSMEEYCGRHVVMSCLDHCSCQERANLIRRVCCLCEVDTKKSALFFMVNNFTAVRVVEKMLDVAEPAQHAMLHKEIAPLIPGLYIRSMHFANTFETWRRKNKL